MKKLKLLIIIAMLGVVTACGNTSKEGSETTASETTKSKVAEVTIKEGQYIDPIGGDTEDDQNVIALEMKVKNTSNDKMYIFDESFYLVEKGDDEKIKPLRVDYQNKIKDFSGEISSGKSLSGTVVFAVEDDKKYELIFSPNSYDEEGNSSEDVEMALDLKKYEDSKKKLDEPVKALQAYIDVVFLQKENKDYDTLIANDSKTDIEMITKEYTNMIKDTFYSYRLSDDEMSKAFESYVGNQREAIELTLTSAGNVGDLAKVKVDFKGISQQAANDLINNFETEYDDTTNDYDSEKREQYAVTKLEDVYSTAEVGEPRDEIFVTMTKKDDKWTIDFKSDDSYENTYLLKAYLGQVD